MASILQYGSRALAALQKRSCGQAVDFRRGSDIAAEITAVIGERVFRYSSADGSDVRSVTRDFICDAADLVILGKTVEPRVGDAFALANEDGDIVVYAIQAPNDEPVFNYVDERQERIRVHTIEDSVEETP